MLAFLQLSGETDQGTDDTENSSGKNDTFFSQIYTLILFTVISITSALARKDLDITAPELKAADY